MMEKPSNNHSNLSAIEIPDLVLGSIKIFVILILNVF